MESMTKQDDPLEANLGDIHFLPMLSHYSYLDLPQSFSVRKSSSIFVSYPSADEQKSKNIQMASQYKDQSNYFPPQRLQEVSHSSQKSFDQQSQQTSKVKHETQPTHARYYSKNACKNIIKRCLRSIQVKMYEQQLKLICRSKGKSYEDFYFQILSHLETVSGPSALRLLLKNKHVGEIFREYLEWYLKERYIRQAVRGGHMTNLKIYIQYKNKELIKILRE